MLSRTQAANSITSTFYYLPPFLFKTCLKKILDMCRCRVYLRAKDGGLSLEVIIKSSLLMTKALLVA